MSTLRIVKPDANLERLLIGRSNPPPPPLPGIRAKTPSGEQSSSRPNGGHTRDTNNGDIKERQRPALCPRTQIGVPHKGPSRHRHSSAGRRSGGAGRSHIRRGGGSRKLRQCSHGQWLWIKNAGRANYGCEWQWEVWRCR